MKYLAGIFSLIIFVSCSPMKLSIPTIFKEQATEYHVAGSKKNKMSFQQFSTSRIRRGAHVTYPGWGHAFLWENLALYRVGVQMQETVIKEKAKFHFGLSDGQHRMEVFGQERQMKRSYEYELVNGPGSFNKYIRPQEFKYLFSAVIKMDSNANGSTWQLLMSNIYEREKDTVNYLFTIISANDNGYATNGVDSIFIKPVTTRNAEGPRGQQGKLPVKMLSGYELSNSDGVIAIIDLIGSNLWLYNELNSQERLVIAGITTALFARRVNDTKW